VDKRQACPLVLELSTTRRELQLVEKLAYPRMSLSIIARSFVADVLKVGPASACVRAARSIKLRDRPDEIAFLLGSAVIKTHREMVAKHDFFFPVSHKSFLNRRLDRNQRLRAARQSYEFIEHSFGPEDIAAMAGEGKALWAFSAGATNFSIRLMLGNHNMYEGALSAAFFLDNRHVGVMSFSVVDGTLFGLSPGPILLLCRNQTTSDRWYQKPLQDAFKHIALPYMMLGAVAGIAQALGLNEIYAITEDSHPHAEDGSVDVMRGSYSAFWEKYNATAVQEGLVRFAVPLESTPLDQVSANHRRRAKGRREVMAAISEAAQANLSSWISDQRRTAPIAKSLARKTPVAVMAPVVLGACDLVFNAGSTLIQTLNEIGAVNFLV